MKANENSPEMLSAFLKRLVESPFCNDTRLVFADWLDEYASEFGTQTGCPRCFGGSVRFASGNCRQCDGTGNVSFEYSKRAEFIRAQCELSKKPRSVYCDCGLIWLPFAHESGDHLTMVCPNGCKDAPTPDEFHRLLSLQTKFFRGFIPEREEYGSRFVANPYCTDSLVCEATQIEGSFEDGFLSSVVCNMIDVCRLDVVSQGFFVDNSEPSVTFFPEIDFGMNDSVRGLVESEPIRRWSIRDKQPALPRSINPVQRDRWMWFRYELDGAVPETQSHIPYPVFDLLEGGERFLSFPDNVEVFGASVQSDAISALSDAVWRFTRKAVGLPCVN